jgi:hypothetical protein
VWPRTAGSPGVVTATGRCLRAERRAGCREDRRSAREGSRPAQGWCQPSRGAAGRCGPRPEYRTAPLTIMISWAGPCVVAAGAHRLGPPGRRVTARPVPAQNAPSAGSLRRGGPDEPGGCRAGGPLTRVGLHPRAFELRLHPNSTVAGPPGGQLLVQTVQYGVPARAEAVGRRGICITGGSSAGPFSCTASSSPVLLSSGHVEVELLQPVGVACPGDSHDTARQPDHRRQQIVAQVLGHLRHGHIAGSGNSDQP